MRKARPGGARTDIRGEIPCPYCHGTKTLVYEGAAGRASVKCANCGRFYSADFEKMSAEKSGAIQNDTLD